MVGRSGAHLLTLFRGRTVGGTGQTIRCAVYNVERGIDVRIEYEDNAEVLREHLVDEYDMDRAAKVAEKWLRELQAKGFVELPVDHR